MDQCRHSDHESGQHIGSVGDGEGGRQEAAQEQQPLVAVEPARAANEQGPPRPLPTASQGREGGTDEGGPAPTTPPVITSSSMPQPSKEEIKEWSVIVSPITLIATWAGLDLEETDHARSLAGEDPDEVWDAIKDIKLQGRKLGFGVRAKVRLLMAGCRAVCGLADPKPKPLAPIIQNIYHGTQTKTTQPAGDTTEIEKPETFELDAVAIQGSKAVVKSMTEEEYIAYKAVVRNRGGDDPPHEAEVSKDQLSALRYLNQKEKSIHVDFAIWMPYGDRNQGRRKFLGMIIAPDGVLKSVEVFGPSNFREWLGSYTVFRTGCLALKLISPARLDAYAEKIRTLSEKYPDAWAIVYQAEARTRREHATRVKHILISRHDQFVNNGWVDDFNPQQPWEAVWHQLASAGNKWWSDQVDTPCWSLALGIARMSSCVHGDAPPASSDAAGSGRAHIGNQRSEHIPIRFKRIASGGGDHEPPAKQQRLALRSATSSANS